MPPSQHVEHVPLWRPLEDKPEAADWTGVANILVHTVVELGSLYWLQ